MCAASDPAPCGQWARLVRRALGGGVHRLRVAGALRVQHTLQIEDALARCPQPVAARALARLEGVLLGLLRAAQGSLSLSQNSSAVGKEGTWWHWPCAVWSMPICTWTQIHLQCSLHPWQGS